MKKNGSYSDLRHKIRELEHTREVLRAIRNVNQLIVMEKNPERLLVEACRLLVANRGFFNAWMARVEDGRPVAPFFHAGFNGGFAPMAALLSAGKLPDCGKNVLERQGPLIFLNPVEQCIQCPIASAYEGRAGMAVRLAHGGQVFGWLAVSMPPEFAAMSEERELLAEVAADIGFALWSIETERERASLAQRFESVLQTTTNAVMTGDREGCITFFNPGAEKLLGCPAEAAVGSPISRFCPEELREEQERNFHWVLETGAKAAYETERFSVDGRRIPVEITLDACTDVQGEVVEVTAILRDISERKRAEATLSASERKYRMLYDEAPLAYQSLDPDGNVLDVNPAWLRTLGYERGEVVGRHFSEFLHPDGRPHFQRNFPAFKERGYVNDVRFKMVHKTGHFIDVSFEGCIGYHPDGSVRQTYCVFKDITEQLRAEAEQRRALALLRAAMDCSPAGIAIANVPDGRLLYVNDAGLGIRGGTREEGVNGIGLDRYVETWRIRHLDGTPFAPEAVPLARAVQRGERCEAEFMIRRPDAKDRVVHAHAAPVLNDDGERMAAIMVFPDITEQKTGEQALRRSERKFREIFNAVSDALYIHDLSGRIREVNTAALRQLGYTREALLGMSVADVEGNARNGEKVREKIHAVRQNRNLVFHSMHRRKTGETFPVEVHSRAIDYEGNSCILSVVRDISERERWEVQRAEMDVELRRRNQFIETILENLPIGLAVNYIDEGVATYMNRAFEEIYGWPKEELKDIPTFFEKVYPDPAYRNQVYARVMADIASGDLERMAWEGLEITDQQGQKKVISAKNIPLYEQNLMISTVQDITEGQKLQAQLRQAQKMEAVGALAGGIAHDFNNILFPILGLSEMLLDELSESHPAHENIREILRAGERGRDLVKQILAFSRQSEQERIPLRISTIIKEAFQLCRSTIPSNIEIRRHIPKDPGLVLADPTQVHQVVMNLLTNAYHAVEAEGGEMSVRFGEHRSEAGEAAEGMPPPGRYAFLAVSDTGPGIPPEIAEKIFEPYFTTKEQGKGTGLGLAVVYGIVKKHGGEITVYSEMGQGTTVTVYFPLMAGTGETVSSPEAAPAETGRERILLVDDEATIVKLQGKILERLGYAVTTRTASPEALETIRADPDGFDLVISDLSMPKMTGFELAQQVYGIRPDLPVILCTGFQRDLPDDAAERFGIRAILTKPISKADLARTVRSVLDGEAG